MTELFTAANIDFKPLTEYIGWFTDNKTEDSYLIQLPPIQRNSVWNSNQIEKLWDSVLRGFPIGSFLLSKRNKGQKARDLINGLQQHSAEDGFFLLDGQQRTRALLLGFRPNEDSRLWIDLNPKLLFENQDYNDRKFLFRLITKYQPWGMNDRNPLEKLHENEKYNARYELYGTSVRYDYNVGINIDVTIKASHEKFSWPVKSGLPVPFDALVRLCGGISGTFREPAWEEVFKLIPDHFLTDVDIPMPDHYPDIIKSLKKLLNNDQKKGDISAVVFLKQGVEIDDTVEEEKVQDSIEVLFRRINSNGTPLQGEEMSYSLLKSAWDDAYDMVTSIVNDKKIGYLFTSTGIVMAAARIARFDSGYADDPQPNGSDFRRWLGENYNNGTSPFLDKMKELIGDKTLAASFHNITERFCDLVLYRYDIDEDDIGIPRKLLLSIKPSLIHPVLIWLFKNSKTTENDESNRTAILRYLLLCLIGMGNGQEKDKASKTVVEVIRNTNGNFPDLKIYRELLEKKLAVRIPEPTTFDLTLASLASGLLRDYNEVMGDEEDIYRDFRGRFWGNKELLLWFQRKYHARWFTGYNPMSNDAYDTPYDYDHILAKSHLITSGGSLNIQIVEPADQRHFYDNRSLYINSIGNFRAWPSWANRTDRNICHTEKMKLYDNDFEDDGLSRELGLKSNSDFLKASAISEDDLNLWMSCEGDARQWPEARRIAWQQAVENRVKYLFKLFYSDLGFYNWITDKTPSY